MGDRVDLAFVEHTARIQIHQHRGRGCFLVAYEYGRLRNSQMDAGRFHARNRFDGAFEFTFQRALVVDLLGELADAELLVVHQFETDRAALRQALGGETQTHFVHLVGRHENRAATVGELVGDVGGLQRGDDRAAVLIRQVAIQHLIVRSARPEPQTDHDGNQHGDREDQRCTRIAAHLRQAGQALAKVTAEAPTAQVRSAAGLAGAGCGAAWRLRAGEAHTGVGVNQRVG